jgi:hypothetical protein
VKVTVTELPLVTDEEEKLTVRPEGAPLEVNRTVWALPDVVAVVRVEVAVPPGVTVPLVGLSAMENALGTTAVTVKV